jgi:hypothetical protein
MSQIKGAPTPPDVDDGVTDLQEKVLGFLEDQTPLPTIINDQVSALVRFYEEAMEDYQGDYHFAKDLAAQLVDMSVAINKNLAGYGP